MKYYGLAGSNGYGVYTEYCLALKDKKSLKYSRLKSFLDFESAKEFAVDTYLSLQYDVNNVYQIDEIRYINYLYMKRRTYKKRSGWKDNREYNKKRIKEDIPQMTKPFTINIKNR